MASDNNGGEREAKRLRSCEPDLKVVLGSGDGEEVEWHHSQSLASKSKCIDAMLSTPMKEKDERIISFPDIAPATWKKMMSFLDSLVAARQMTAKDALEVALFYDKYEFVEGRKLCDMVIADHLSASSLEVMEKKFAIDLELIIDLVHLAHQSSLKDAFKGGMNYIWSKLEESNRGTPYGRMMFTEGHLRKLAPLLVSSENREQLGLHWECNKSYLITHGRVSGEPDVPLEHDDFPKQFVTQCKSWDEWDLLRRCISHVELSGADSADGAYQKDMGCWDVYVPPDGETRRSKWGGRWVTFGMRYWQDDEFEGWAIVREYPPTRFDEDGEADIDSIVKKKCWIAPYSKNRKWPPMRGWIPADPLARRNPTIKYILNESIQVMER